MELLALYSKKCKSCKHLDPEEPKAHDDCHFSKGNKQCPASEIQFAIVGQAQRYAAALKKAKAKGDIEKEIQILTAVQKRSEAFQFKFREAC